jgi:hypothetical protein
MVTASATPPSARISVTMLQGVGVAGGEHDRGALSCEQDAGLPSGPRRRTPGLRREEIAVLAHISTEYYVRLEQGRAPRPSGDVLAGIVGPLRLTDTESDHLHLLAGTMPTRSSLHRRDVRPSILTLLGAFRRPQPS